MPRIKYPLQRLGRRLSPPIKQIRARASRAHRAWVVACLAAGIALVPSGTALAQCAPAVRDGGFESQRTAILSSPWQAEGGAGIDRNRGFSYRGRNNAWAASTRGWSAIRQRVYLTAGYLHRLTAFIRTSSNVRAGYIGFRTADQAPVAETKFDGRAAYSAFEVSYRPTQSGYYYVFAGLWALNNQNSWFQLDEVGLTAPCNDNPGNPVDNR